MNVRLAKKSKKVSPLRLFLVLSFLFVSVYGSAVWATSFLLRRTERELVARGLPIDLKILIPPPVAAEENAAPGLARAFQLLMSRKGRGAGEPCLAGELTRYAETVKPEKRNPMADMRLFLPARRQEIRRQFANPVIKDGLRGIERATEKRACVFPVDYRLGPELRSRYLPQAVQAARLLAVRAWLRSDAGQNAAALRDVRTCFRLGALLGQDDLLATELARGAVDQVAAQTLITVLARVPPAHRPTAVLSQLFSELNARPKQAVKAELCRMLDAERILFASWFSRLLDRPLTADERADELSPARFYAGYLWRPWFIWDCRRFVLQFVGARDRVEQLADHDVFELPGTPFISCMFIHNYYGSLDGLARLLLTHHSWLERARKSLRLAGVRKKGEIGGGEAGRGG